MGYLYLFYGRDLGRFMMQLQSRNVDSGRQEHGSKDADNGDKYRRIIAA